MIHQTQIKINAIGGYKVKNEDTRLIIPFPQECDPSDLS